MVMTGTVSLISGAVSFFGLLLRVALLFLGLTLFSGEALAQSASSKAAAEALFDEGVQLLKAGKVAEACVKLERSQQVDPGIGTLLYLGECYRKAGRTASAWATFREAASKADAAGEYDRARVGMQRADELAPMLTKVTFQVAEENKNLEGLEILQSGVVVDRALWGTAVPVDPGELVVTARAPGYETYETTMQVEVGPAEATFSIPALVATKDAQVTPEGQETEPASDAKEQPTRGQGRRTAAFITGGVGIVGLALGGVFGVLAMGKESKAEEVCGDSTTCPAGSGGEEYSRQALTNATVSTVGFAVGGALLATGIVLFVTAPKKSEGSALLKKSEGSALLKVSPRVGGAEMSLGGSF